MAVGAAESEDVVAVGEVIAGKFRVEGILGRGGMGIVAVAHHLQLQRRVAVKLLRPDVARRTDAGARFLREAQALAGLQTEHVVRVLDVGQLENGAPFMVMEYLAGKDLDQLQESRGPLPISEAVGYLLQVCEAMAEAHSRGIIHRDLKPGNIFLTHRADGSPLVKILDFGISKVTGVLAPIGHDLTGTSDTMGSPAYMSPEQLKSFKTVDQRTDIWALGVILHNLVSERWPFEAPTVPQIIAKILSDAPTPLREHLPNAPVELESVVFRCLARDREQRFQSVPQFAMAIAPFASPSAAISIQRLRGLLLPNEFAATDPHPDESPLRQIANVVATTSVETLPLVAPTTVPMATIPSPSTDPRTIRLRGAPVAATVAAPPQSNETATIALPPGPAVTASGMSSPTSNSMRIQMGVVMGMGALVLAGLLFFLFSRGETAGARQIASSLSTTTERDAARAPMPRQSSSTAADGMTTPAAVQAAAPTAGESVSVPFKAQSTPRPTTTTVPSAKPMSTRNKQPRPTTPD